ncbi:restriction endonuclease subunit S [Celerinatantimonas sp. YJH-8]|uniref:restriction endonuclease subunit S n=1 Tax=Celerinatantimonas sp. YJH-8 TaxID=3228714 RepID=UPI0038BE8845
MNEAAVMATEKQAVPKGYKQTEVGAIPEDWGVATIEELACIIDPQPDHRTPPESSNGEPYIGISDFINSREVDWTASRKIISKAVDKQEKSFQLQKGDIVFGKIGTIGVPKFVPQVPFRFALSANVILLQPKNVEPIYLMAFFYSELFQKTLKSELHSTSQAAFGMNKMRLIKLPLPPIKEQTAIANALSDMDALLTELEQLIAKKQAIKTATMQQLLTGKTRLPQFANHEDGSAKGYKLSELGEIPEDWRVKPIESLIQDLRGGAPFKPSDFTNTGVKVLPKGGVVRGGVLKVTEKDQQFCSKDWSLKYSKNCIDNRYTIVVLRDLVPSGPSIGLMVNIPIDEKYVLAQGVYGFIAEDSETSNYLIQYSNTTQYRKAANEIMVGSTQVHITNGAFKALKIPLPPREERGAIAVVLSDMDNEIQTLEKRLNKTRQLKQGMMQELLTGKTRLV